MNIDISILYLFVAVSFGLVGIGYLLRFSIPLSLLIFVAGGLMTALFIMTDNVVVGHSVDPIGSPTSYSYNVESFTGASDICGGAGCGNVRGEYVFSSSSMLWGDTIDCIDIPLRKLGAPTGTATIGVYDHAQATDNPILKSFGTIDVSTLDVNIWMYKTFCLNNEVYVMGDQDVIGVRYDGGDTSNAVRVAVTTGDVFDSSQTEHSRQDATTNIWTNFATTDTTMRTYLRSDLALTTTEIVSPFTEELKVFMVLMGVIMLLVGSAVEFQARRN